MKVIFNGKELDIKEGTRVIDLIDDKEKRYVGCFINGDVKPLLTEIRGESKIDLVDLKRQTGIRIYQSSLRFIIAMAVKNVLPKKKIIFNYSVSRSVFAQVLGLGHPLDNNVFNLIANEVDRIIKADLPINYIKKNREDVIKFYESVGYYDKIQMLKYENSDLLSLYECDGYLNYLYFPLVPSTGYIKKYLLKQYAPGFLMSYPRIECNGELPPIEDEKNFRAALKEANRWSNTIKLESIAQMNDIVEHKEAIKLINLCETRHNAQLCHLGDKIENNIENIKIICVAGPSSSGKTTFTNRLKIELESRGIEPYMISMDNFYRGSNYPLDKEGKPDYEHINSLNLELFDECIIKLISGDEVKLPIFNFHDQSITFTEPVKLKKNQPILIEGIHALNPIILPSVPDDNKYKIFIAPLGQFRYDMHTPVSISDIRLMRRIVRDNYTRSTPIEKTLDSWKSVRIGEFKWIFPYQNNADFIFNSELTYEILVMKNYIVPLLNTVSVTCESYNSARRLLKYLNYFEGISDKWVPCNSILREFIGNSIFYTKDYK